MSGHLALLCVSGRVRYQDLRAGIAAELALQGGPQVGEGRLTHGQTALGDTRRAQAG